MYRHGGEICKKLWQGIKKITGGDRYGYSGEREGRGREGGGGEREPERGKMKVSYAG